MYVVRIEISPKVELLTTRLGLGNQVSYGAIVVIYLHFYTSLTFASSRIAIVVAQHYFKSSLA
jgi:hypothetical protein